jgi:hypothetical protein
MGAPEAKPNPSGNPGHSGSMAKSAPTGKSGGSKSVAKGKSFVKGRIVTPSRGGKLMDGATSRIKGNRMKSRTWSGKRK